MTRLIKPPLLLFVVFFYIFPCAAAEQTAPAQDNKGKSDSKEASRSVPQGKQFSTGVYFGHIIAIDPRKRYLFVKPTDPHYSRKHFYLDRRTRYTYVLENRRRRRQFRHLVEGQKVAIRYFSEDRLAVVDEIFVVFGEFSDPEIYVKNRFGKKKKPQAEAKEGEESESEAEGEASSSAPEEDSGSADN